MLNTQINFSTANTENLKELGISSLDFLALVGSNVIATCVAYEDNCGPSYQDGTVWQLEGEDAPYRWVLLTNGNSCWQDGDEPDWSDETYNYTNATSPIPATSPDCTAQGGR